MGLNSEADNCVALLRWWHQYQAQRMMQATDTIRNGLLQEMLGLRRRLELTYQAREERSDCALNLADLKRLYGELEALCDRLDAPFGQDSLPLALQHLLHPWVQKGAVSMTLPTGWTPEPGEQTQLLILLVEQIVEVVFQGELVPPSPPAIAQFHLQEQAGSKHLTIEVVSPSAITLMLPSPENPTATPCASESLPLLTPFLQTFCLFTQGAYALEQGAQSWKLTLHWQPLTHPVGDSVNAHRITQRINP